MIELNFKEFLKHINLGDFDHYQQPKSLEIQEDLLVVCGPLSEEVEPLYNIVMNNILEGHIISIGEWLGLSTITQALALKERYKEPKYKIYSIDPHDREHSIASDGLETWFASCPFDMSEKFLENIKKWEVEDYVEYHRCFSYHFSKHVENVAMLFIDSDHRYPSIIKELTKFVPMLKKDGLLVMHDRSLVMNAFDDYNKERNNLLLIPNTEIDHLNRLIIAKKL